jgi:hypothetical protein
MLGNEPGGIAAGGTLELPIDLQGRGAYRCALIVDQAEQSCA